MNQFEKENRKLIMISVMLVMCILLTNVTYALIKYTLPDTTNIDITVNDLGIIYDTDATDISSSLPIATSKDGALTFKSEFWKTIESDVYGRIYLNVTNIDNILRNSEIIKWEVWSNNTKLNSGSLKCTNAGSELTLYQNFLLQNSQQFFTVYIWADFNLADSTISNTTFNGEIKAQASQIKFTESEISPDCEVINPLPEDTTPTIVSTIDTTSTIVGETVNLMDGISVTDPSGGTVLTKKVEVNGTEISKTSGTTVELGLTKPSNTVTYTVTNEKGESASVSRTYNVSTKSITQYSTANETTSRTPECGSCACGANGEVTCVGCSVCPWDGVSYSTSTSCGTYSGWSTSKGSGSCCRKRSCTVGVDGNTSCKSYTSC